MYIVALSWNHRLLSKYRIMNVHDVLNLSIYAIHQVARKRLRQIMSKLRVGTAELRDKT